MQDAELIVKSIALEEAAHEMLGQYAIDISFDEVRKLALLHMPVQLAALEHEYTISSSKTLLDKLGIDMLVDINGSRWAIDVTVGNKCVVRTKLRRLAFIKPFLDDLGCEAVVIRSKRGMLPSNIIHLIENAPMRDGVRDVRLGTNLRQILQ